MKIIEKTDGIIVKLTADDFKTPLDLDQVKGDWHTIINNSEGVFKVGNEIRFVYITNNQHFIEFRIEETEIQQIKIHKLLNLLGKNNIL